MPKKPAKKMKEESRQQKLKNILVYFVFMVFYTYLTTADLNNSGRFYFASQLSDQFTTNEMEEQFSPTWGKNFNDVGSVQEYYQWMISALVPVAFSPTSTFDGSDSRADMPPGRVLSYGKIMGAIRVAQLRSKRRDCGLPGALRQADQAEDLRCYGDDVGGWSEASEATAAYGGFQGVQAPNGTGTGLLTTAFLRDGIHGRTGEAAQAGSVAQERALLFGAYTSKRLFSRYGAPTHAVLLNPADGEAINAAVVANLAASQYIDLHTRAVFVDVAVLNPTVGAVCQLRLVAEMPAGGGVLTSFEVETAPLFGSGRDGSRAWVRVAVGLFYAFYLLKELHNMRILGCSGYLGDVHSRFMLLNIGLYIAQLQLRMHAAGMLPAGAGYNLSSAAFDITLRPALITLRTSTLLQASNTFLNWFRVVEYLSIAPAFGVLVGTLSRAAPDMLRFAAVFCIIFYGFAQVHSPESACLHSPQRPPCTTRCRAFR
jgi:hypothetical protein